MIFFLVNICTPDFLVFVHNLRMKYIDSNKLSDPQFKRYTGISWSTFYLMVEQLQKHVSAKGRPPKLSLEGLFVILFSQMNSATLAIMAMTIFALFTHMACGATYALVPFIDCDALGGVAGIIGAGGNVGAVAAGFLLKGMLDIQTTLMVLGGLVVIAASCVLMIRFSVEHKEKEQLLYEQAVNERHLAEAQQ